MVGWNESVWGLNPSFQHWYSHNSGLRRSPWLPAQHAQSARLCQHWKEGLGPKLIGLPGSYDCHLHRERLLQFPGTPSPQSNPPYSNSNPESNSDIWLSHPLSWEWMIAGHGEASAISPRTVNENAVCDPLNLDQLNLECDPFNLTSVLWSKETWCFQMK